MKIKKNIGMLFLLSLPLLACGQKHDYVWMFGYNSNATSNYPGVEGVILNYNETPFSVDYIQTVTNITVSNATIADTFGNLLFYTNGCQIANRFHEIMENGDSLNFGAVFNERCNENAFGYPAGPQSCLILSVPGNNNNYLVFHDKIEYVYEPEFDVITLHLLFTRVNVLIDRVIEKNIPIVQDTISAGQLTAVKHSNGLNWWVIVPQYLSNKYYYFELTENGIENLSEQQIGNPTIKQGEGGGQAVFSPDGTKYIRYTPADGLFIFDFNRNTGQLSNFRFIAIDDGAFTGGVAVSPNSRYLYVCSEDFVYQFDLQAEDIEASRVTVAEYDGYQSPFPTKFFNAQLAPDCKIYINSFATVDVLHVIHNPDEPGLACNFEQHAVQLPFNHARSLPHFPNYRLGPLVEGEDPPPPCEPVVSTEEEVPPVRQQAYVFPNPAPGYFKVVFEQALRRPGRVVLYNGLGQAALETQLEAGSREFRIELSGVAPGLYFYGVFRDGEVVKGGKLVVSR
ncbi:MAG: T9SS type A sorting domain-containing protein [Phaeodactylibacter sp.]|nr:T9SS type A sorting domain-containing protein [Phaeodactylibacter sp.]